MTEKATHGEVLDALLIYWLCQTIGGFRGIYPGEAGIPVHVAMAVTEALKAQGYVPGELTARSRALVLLTRAIAAEEAADRLETARAALLDAASEVAADFGDPGGGREFDQISGELLTALHSANEEFQEAQLQAYSPHEAAGLVEVTSDPEGP